MGSSPKLKIRRLDEVMGKTAYLLGREQMVKRVAEIHDRRSQAFVKAIIDGVEQFYEEDPSSLASSFDLVFFVEVLKYLLDEEVGNLRRAFHGGIGDFGEPSMIENVDPATDVHPQGIRSRQALNYAVGRDCRKITDALLALMTAAHIKQVPNTSRSSPTGMVPVEVSYPAEPFDYLFMVRAVDYALKPGQPARILLEEP